MFLVAFIPCISLAATAPRDFKGVVKWVLDMVDILVYLLFALTLVVFLWGLVNSWILHGGEEDGVDNGKKYMEAGIIGFVVMVSLWGIVYILKRSFIGL